MSQQSDKCEAILKAIVRLCNEYIETYLETDGDPTKLIVGFGPDWGKDRFTVYVGDQHAHITGPTFGYFVDRLYQTLVEREGAWSLRPDEVEIIK